MKSIATSILVLALSQLVSQEDSIKIVLKLKSVNDVITFNQPHVSPNALEYAWEIKFNSDNNITTGDAQGFDVGLALINYKYGSSLSYTGTIISGTDQYTRIYNGTSISYGNALSAYFNFADTSIIIAGSTVNTELASITPGDPFYVYTYGNTANGVISDSLIHTNGSYSDSQGDVGCGFLDIVGMKMQSTTIAGFNPNNKEDIATSVFPNPCTDKVSVNASDELTVELISSAGICLLRSNNHEVETSAYPRGIYSLRITTQNEVQTIKLIIN